MRRYAPEIIKVKQCSHYWLIEPPKGEFSLGRCKLCRAKGKFANSTSKVKKGLYPYEKDK